MTLYDEFRRVWLRYFFMKVKRIRKLSILNETYRKQTNMDYNRNQIEPFGESVWFTSSTFLTSGDFLLF